MPNNQQNTVSELPSDIKVFNKLYELVEEYCGELDGYIPSLAKLVAEHGSEYFAQALSERETAVREGLVRHSVEINLTGHPFKYVKLKDALALLTEEKQ